MGTRAHIRIEDTHNGFRLFRQHNGNPANVIQDVIEVVENYDDELAASAIATHLLKVAGIRSIGMMFSSLNSDVEDEIDVAAESQYKLLGEETNVKSPRAYCRYKFHYDEDVEGWCVRYGYEHPEQGTVWKSDLPLQAALERYGDETRISDVIED